MDDANTVFKIYDGGFVGIGSGTANLGVNPPTSALLSVVGNVSAESYSGNLDASYLTGVVDNTRLPSSISVSNITGNLAGDAFGISNISASNITSGSLPVARGGTGVTTSTGTGSVVLSTNPAFEANVSVAGQLQFNTFAGDTASCENFYIDNSSSNTTEKWYKLVRIPEPQSKCNFSIEGLISSTVDIHDCHSIRIVSAANNLGSAYHWKLEINETYQSSDPLNGINFIVVSDTDAAVVYMAVKYGLRCNLTLRVGGRNYISGPPTFYQDAVYPLSFTGTMDQAVDSSLSVALPNNFKMSDNYSVVYQSNTGRVGIGTTAPTATLDVVGNVHVSGNVTAALFSGNGYAISNVNSANLIGTIDTTRLPSNISVAGNISAGGYLFGNGSFLTGVSTSLTGNGFAISSINAANLVGNIEADLNFDIGSVPGNALYGEIDGDVIFTGDIDANVLVGTIPNDVLPNSISVGGNIGIGTSSPAYALDIGGFSANTNTLRIGTASTGNSEIKLMETNDTYGFTMRNVGGEQVACPSYDTMDLLLARKR